MKDECRYGHPTPLRADRDASGYCLKCKSRINAAAYRRRKAQEQENRRAAKLLEQIVAAT